MPRNQIPATHAAADPARGFNKYFVAALMPVCIVDSLEAVQVDKHDCSHTVAACCARFIQPLEE